MAERKSIHFAEDEDVARARALWQENGRPIIIGLALGLAGIAGYNYWQGYQQQQGEQASLLFDQLRSGVEDAVALRLGEQLQADHSATVYAALGTFSLAKIFVEQGDYDSAAGELQWVLDNSADAGLRHIARSRLASVYLAENRHDDVIDLLSGVEAGTFAARYSELLGDAHAARNGGGDREKAREHYAESLAELPEGSLSGAVMQLKIDNLAAQ